MASKGQPKGYWTGARNPRWKGGVSHSGGYVLLLMPTHPNANKAGYVREHVKIMSDKLGRRLHRHEIVHHLNGLKSDNRLDNLMVMTRSVHASGHHKYLLKPRSLKNLKARQVKGECRVLHTPCQCGQPYYATGMCRTCYKRHYAHEHLEQKRSWRIRRRALGLSVI